MQEISSKENDKILLETVKFLLILQQILQRMTAFTSKWLFLIHSEMQKES